MRHRNWIITEYVENESKCISLFGLFRDTEPKFLQGQLERCPTTSRLHFQAFISYENARTLQSLKESLSPTAHFTGCTILRAAAINYGAKEETRIAGPWTYGIPPQASVLKTDWSAVLRSVLHKRYDEIPPQVVIAHCQKFDTLCSLFASDPRATLPNWLPNPWGLVIPSRRGIKRRHYWIWSATPNVGKTTLFALPLEKAYRCKIVCGKLSFWPISGQEELLILDDYNHASLKFNELNQMCDGTFTYDRKYSSMVRMSDPLIIILSNNPIWVLYPNMNQYLYARFNELEVQ